MEPVVFWVYLACRYVGNLQASFYTLHNTASFDRAEKDTRGTADKLKQLGGPLIGITYPHSSERGIAHYGEYPSTLNFMYALYGVFTLTSLANAETTIRNLHILPSSVIDSTGQVIALVIAIDIFFHVCWLFGFLFFTRGNWQGWTNVAFQIATVTILKYPMIDQDSSFHSPFI
jgi:hypothetical protein